VIDNPRPVLALDGDPASIELAQRAASFHAAIRFFPKEERAAIETLYRFCRAVDDVADNPNIPDEDALATLDAVMTWLSGDRQCGQLAASLAGIGHLITSRQLDTWLLRCLVEGVRSDRLTRERADWVELRRYCFQVAGSVGMLLAQLLGARQAEALSCAATLGVAMQLTNIVRDVGEDLDRGIVYLPATDMARFGYDRARLERRQVDGDFVQLLRWQIERARRHYAAGLAGLAWLTPSTRFPIGLAARLYAGILDQVEANGYDVFRRRASTSLAFKVRESLLTALGLYLTGWTGGRALPTSGDSLAGVASTIQGEVAAADRGWLVAGTGVGGTS
jgi:phytoene synthase